ncbi:MAG: hypothetical protein JWP38_2915 [Herbaspirillum sp.]|nr:hypothetical protein [Herbaspirillum sp.]
MARAQNKNLLTRTQKLFRMDSVYPLDANNLIVDEAVSRLFVYMRTGGRQIVRTDKAIYTDDTEDAESAKAILHAALENNPEKFSGINDDERKALMTAWVESNFALMSRRGKSGKGEYRVSSLRPLHFAVIKLFNPQVKRQDRYLSDFFYNAIKDDPELTTNADSLFKQFFGVGVRTHGDNDYRIDEASLKKLSDDKQLDIEMLFLLRLLEPFPTDTFGSRAQDQVQSFSYLCPEQIDLLRQDLKLLFLYKDHIPRRELINYMTTLMVFHASLYFYQTVRITNSMVRDGRLPPARGSTPQPGEHRTNAPFDLDFFCDLTNGHDLVVDELAKNCFTSHFKEIEQYFKSAFYMKKLEDYAGPSLSPEQRKERGRPYVELLLKAFGPSAMRDGHFNRDIQDIRERGFDEETEQYNPEVEQIIEISNQRGLDKLQTFVEILSHFQYGTLREQHRKLLAGLCGTDLDRGFMAGRGRTRRKYVLGNELLEVLIQLAVLDRRVDGTWQSRPIPIQDFVDWMRGRYGLLIDTLGPSQKDDEQTNRARATNLLALKTRLRQLGFFTDLSDASNSQVIVPRFQIASLQSGLPKAS